VAERVFRCAVYTRKSTEDGLEQEFNSLDAQYAACAAYALSQKHEGWVLNPERYDDGGFSGGNMERPGLKHLMADVAAGKVDIILLYKIDRLTRSLADFAKIVEVLDKAEASFVSITQSFNTTTSMGRLTLNMLLSFAQFEREVTGERIRDKIAASKRRGMWMGGPVPLGYDVLDRKLVPNPQEAETVRHIMQRYLALGSVAELVDELSREGYRTKVQQRVSGPHKGGCAFRRGTLFHMLSNRIYRGMIIHKKECFEGEHKAIVPEELWDEVQATLARRAQGPSRRLKARHPSLLVGKLVDGEGRAMTTSHATKPGVRYRYYVTRPDLLDGTPAWRVSAHDLEQLVCTRLAELMVDTHGLRRLLGDRGDDAQVLNSVIEGGDLMAAQLRSGSATTRLSIIAAAVELVSLCSDYILVTVSPAGLLGALGHAREGTAMLGPVHLNCPATRVRKGHQLRLIIPSATAKAPAPLRDEKLLALVAHAHAARQLVAAHPDNSIATIAKAEGRCRARLTQLLGLSCLAPDIVSAIVEGRQPPSLTAQALAGVELPLAWPEQRVVLGFS
jgi:site-specific DNA recombinase